VTEPEAGEGLLGLVVSGAAARGPYEAGAVAEVLRALPAEQPLVLLGTSSGAITVGLLAQYAREGLLAGERVVEVWQGAHEVYTNPSLTLPVTGVRLAARFAGWPRGEVSSILDVAPLRRLAHDEFHPDAVADAVDGDTRVRSVGVAATVCPPDGTAARTRLFVDGLQPCGDSGYATDVVPTRLRAEHLLASAAIPGLFEPVEITQPPDHRGWYVDGGVRLNAPLEAALAFGVSELIVVSGHSVRPAAVPGHLARRPPDLDAAAAVAIRAVLTDALGDDIQALARHNRTARRLMSQFSLSEGDLPQRPVPFRVIAPGDGDLAKLAAGAYTARTRGPWDPAWGIERLLAAGGSGVGHDELLSMVFFDPEYARSQVERGRADAVAAMGKPATDEG
jgi:NTE family protein